MANAKKPWVYSTETITAKRMRCGVCGELTHNTMRINEVLHCYPCECKHKFSDEVETYHKPLFAQDNAEAMKNASMTPEKLEKAKKIVEESECK